MRDEGETAKRKGKLVCVSFAKKNKILPAAPSAAEDTAAKNEEEILLVFLFSLIGIRGKEVFLSKKYFFGE